MLQSTCDLIAAKKAYRDAIEIHDVVIDVYNLLAILLVSQNRIEDTISTLKDALRIDPNYTVAANNLGRLFLSYKNDPDTVVGYFQQAIPSISHVIPATVFPLTS